MAIVELTYYRALCDGCGLNLTSALSDGMSAWEERSDALDQVRDEHLGYDLLGCWGCKAEYVKTLSGVEADRLDDGEYWARMAFAGWLRAKHAGLVLAAANEATR